MIAGIEEMENLDSSEIHPRRLNATEVLTPQKKGKLLDSKPQMEQLNCLEETTESENPLVGGNNLYGVKISEKNFKASRKGLNRQKQKITLKPGKTSGQSKVTLFIVITLNLEFNSTCRKKNISNCTETH